MGERVLFGDGLRWLRKKADLSQKEMATAVGVTQPTYSRWESGEAEPRASDLRRIIEVLEIPPATFFRFLGFEIAPDAESVGEWIQARYGRSARPASAINAHAPAANHSAARDNGRSDGQDGPLPVISQHAGRLAYQYAR